MKMMMNEGEGRVSTGLSSVIRADHAAAAAADSV